MLLCLGFSFTLSMPVQNVSTTAHIICHSMTLDLGPLLISERINFEEGIKLMYTVVAKTEITAESL